MIFTGDFAQLPPIRGEGASLYGRHIGQKTTMKTAQDQALGKSLWHQVTNVVILRQNMRQREQSTEDGYLRTALENLRYNACTQKDLQFLDSRVTSMMKGRTSVTEKGFRNVSVITSWNVHKDETNRLGSIRFANETGQQLTDFYSEDSLRRIANKHPNDISEDQWHRRKLIHLKEISDDTDLKIPGKLSLCIGLPVMIRRNAATELGITKGQEGTVYAWQSCKGSKGQQVLDTLFVTLFEGLPLNVVPLGPTKNRVCVNLPNNRRTMITREQVEVLPNFAMTDYASQGKTRPFNVVDLHKCKTHQSLYTWLSRSASAAGTIILQGLSEGLKYKITKGASGALRQEFHELELLDEITGLRFEGTLPSNITGLTRNELIMAYRKHSLDKTSRPS
ncbi:hypothetical protein EV421DRAFT_1891537 [Armillaria borealis]|uniref:DNA helicase n=1 Tax=Armillaria borealis TaxID=47425 RepID=A0AA39JD22_9AGAR|nr:hypothetical protein EV421DRAFT_1891537 [Armillaria borealis]